MHDETTIMNEGQAYKAMLHHVPNERQRHPPARKRLLHLLQIHPEWFCDETYMLARRFVVQHEMVE